MRTLLLGARGMLGKDIAQDWSSDDLVPADSRNADIGNLEQLREFVTMTRPDWILLAAAYTDVDGSEKNPSEAFAVNARGTANVARVAADVDAKLFYVGTDYVFDGTSTRPYEPNDRSNPLNVYGASKLAGEEAVQKYAKQWCIGRTSWLFGAAGNSFPEKIIRAAETRSELKVVADQVGSPTFTRDLSAAIKKLMDRDARGIVHIANSGVCSWFEFAKEVLKEAGIRVPMRPIKADEIGRPAKRPAYSVLSQASLHRFGIRMRNWKETLPDYLRDLRAAGKL